MISALVNFCKIKKKFKLTLSDRKNQSWSLCKSREIFIAYEDKIQHQSSCTVRESINLWGVLRLVVRATCTQVIEGRMDSTMCRLEIYFLLQNCLSTNMNLWTRWRSKAHGNSNQRVVSGKKREGFGVAQSVTWP